MTLHHRMIFRALLAGVLAPVIAGCSLLPFGAPTATPTQAPSATPEPVTDTPVPEPTPSYLYFDTFTDPASGWPTVNAESSKAGYHPPDAYHLEVSAPETFVFTFREQDFNDFSAQLQVYVENAGETGQWRHGLIVRRVSDEGFYVFTINPGTQSWQVLKRSAATASAGGLARPAAQDPIWTVLSEGANATIVAERQAVNTLRVDAQGPNLTFSVNGEGVIALSDGDYGSGDFGFYLENFDQTLTHIHFDELAVLPYDPATVPVAPTQAATATATPTETATPTPATGGQPPPTAPGTFEVPDLGTFIPPDLATLIPDVVGSIVP